MKAAHALIALFLLFSALIATAAEPRQIQGTVEDIAASYGNIDTSIVAAAFATLGVKQGDSFQVAFSGKHFSVYLGDTYSDVPKGDWVAFMTADGKLRIARNMDDAAQALGVKKGDTITLSH